jgi:hypothetical protein
MNPDEAPTTPVRFLDFDLPCQKCGYNLRGLSGEIVRCPECGRENATGGLAVSEADVARELRSIESALNAGALVQWLGCSLAVPLVAMLITVPQSSDELLPCCFVPATLVIVTALVLFFYATAVSGGSRELRRFLLRFEAAALGACILVTLPSVGGLTLLWAKVFDNAPEPPYTLEVCVLLLTLPLVAVALFVARRPLRKWQQRFRAAFRETATSRVRALVRERLEELRHRPDLGA